MSEDAPDLPEDMDMDPAVFEALWYEWAKRQVSDAEEVDRDD